MKLLFRFLILFLVVLVAPKLAPAATPSIDLPGEASAWIQDMKTDSRGPFEGIRWFCPDGRVLPARAGGCGREEGVQHGLWNERVRTLREAGFPIATLYADVDHETIETIRAKPGRLAWLLLERYLVAADDGWIFRRARFYRGALQAEDEGEGAERLLRGLLEDPKWRSEQYFLLREAARLLPRETSSEALSEIRATATRLARNDSRFMPIRNKLHALPEGEDAQRVREHASNLPVSRRAAYEALAAQIEQTFEIPDLRVRVAQLANEVRNSELEEALRRYASEETGDRTFLARVQSIGRLLAAIREGMQQEQDVLVLESLLDLSLELERTIVIIRSDAEEEVDTIEDSLRLLGSAIRAAYGTGVLSGRTYRAGLSTVADLLRSGEASVLEYYRELKYLSTIPGWASSEVEWSFHGPLDVFSRLERQVHLYTPDRLRSSALAMFSSVLDRLLADASRRAGMTHLFFERTTPIGLTGLNPGLARGELVLADERFLSGSQARSAIVLVPETVAELPPVAGILTERSGNTLSHVQLLARNLGIPNVVVGESLLAELRRRAGRRVVLAVSSAGRVQLAIDAPEWEPVFEQPQSKEVALIRPDLRRLDLDEQRIIPLAELREKHSGRTVGPKAARLGELKNLYPERVADAVVLPFGIFASLLRQRVPEGGTLFEWMQREYREIAAMPMGAPRDERLERTLRRIRTAILTSRFKPEFRAELQRALEERFGPEGTYGVFVRSDTNVEDLPSFTGAGLNLTVPNVIGFEPLLDAILRVWASPFEERAFAWRQGQMEGPEHVYVSVLIQRAVPVQKSGVLITANIVTGETDSFTVAVNHGIGGAVNNQEAESLIVQRATGEVRLKSEATARTEKYMQGEGGLGERPITVKERVLLQEELLELYQFIESELQRYPRLQTESGEPLPADIEFGFLDGKLVLFQIRPFLESRAARANRYLLALDGQLQAAAGIPVRFSEKVGEI